MCMCACVRVCVFILPDDLTKSVHECMRVCVCVCVCLFTLSDADVHVIVSGIHINVCKYILMYRHYRHIDIHIYL